MKVITVVYYKMNNTPERSTILANDIEEAGRFVEIMEDLQSCAIEHIFVEQTPTSFSTVSRNERGWPTAIRCRNKNTGDDHIVKQWTQLPRSIGSRLGRKAG